MLNDCETWNIVCFSMATALFAPIFVEALMGVYSDYFTYFRGMFAVKRYILKYKLNTINVGKNTKKCRKSSIVFPQLPHKEVPTCVFFFLSFFQRFIIGKTFWTLQMKQFSIIINTLAFDFIVNAPSSPKLWQLRKNLLYGKWWLNR